MGKGCRGEEGLGAAALPEAVDDGFSPQKKRESLLQKWGVTIFQVKHVSICEFGNGVYCLI